MFLGEANPLRQMLHSAKRASILPLMALGLLGWSGAAFAYRPFDSTDAAVADLGELEVELGPIGFRRNYSERTLIAPGFVVNYGFMKNWELVLEGRGEHPLSPGDVSSRFVDNNLFLKGVLFEGALQDKSGPSIATEFGILLPEINGVPKAGASWATIISDRWAWGTIHFNAGAALTREQHGDLFVGTIVEGPHNWLIRPVGEVRYEREFGGAVTLSGVAGVIWTISKTLAVDVAVKEAWVNWRAETEIRAGLTFAVSRR